MKVTERRAADWCWCRQDDDDDDDSDGEEEDEMEAEAEEEVWGNKSRHLLQLPGPISSWWLFVCSLASHLDIVQ